MWDLASHPRPLYPWGRLLTPPRSAPSTGIPCSRRPAQQATLTECLGTSAEPGPRELQAGGPVPSMTPISAQQPGGGHRGARVSETTSPRQHGRQRPEATGGPAPTAPSNPVRILSGSQPHHPQSRPCPAPSAKPTVPVSAGLRWLLPPVGLGTAGLAPGPMQPEPTPRNSPASQKHQCPREPSAPAATRLGAQPSSAAPKATVV